jgi:Bax protein
MSPPQVKRPSKLHFMRFIVILIFLPSCGGASNSEIVGAKILAETKEVYSPSDILSLTDSIVTPILYSHINGLDSLPIDIKKDKFISALLPAILVAKHNLQQQENRLWHLIQGSDWERSDSLFFDSLTKNYKITDASRLLSAIKTHPNSIILAQAVVESGWGNSRIFYEANNLFGIWSYNKNEPRIATNINRGDKTIFLRKYTDISESIADYFTTIGRTNAYQQFREERLNTDDPFELTPFLDHYSERRQAYVDQLNEIIRYNDLTKYDSYQIDPAYISN